MELEKDSYTKEEVQELINEQETEITNLTTQFDTTVKEHEEMKEKLEGYEDLKKSNLSNSIKLEMVKNGIDEELFDLVESDDVEISKTKISKLVELNKKKQIDNSYKPESHQSDDEYSVAEKKGDTEKMLKSKFSKLFNN